MTRSGVCQRRKGAERDAIVSIGQTSVIAKAFGRGETSMSVVKHKWRLLYRP
jgi:hypothetical protein